MPDAASARTIRAVVETILPATDGLPGAIDLGVDRFVIDLIELAVPGFVDLTATLLDAYAAEHEAGAGFAGLPQADRTAVLRTMAQDESEDVAEVVSVLLVFTLGGVYSEWSGSTDEDGTWRPPPSWREIGYGGPARGHPTYLGP